MTDAMTASPLWLDLALAEIDVREYTARQPGPNGEQSNPRIETYQREAGQYHLDDQIAWCASGLGYVLHEAGLPHLGTGAAAYGAYGDRCAFRRGAIMPMHRGEPLSGKGHVTLAYDLGPCSLHYVTPSGRVLTAHAGPGEFIGYGGNQHDQWCFAPYGLERLIAGPRWPTAAMLAAAGLSADGTKG